jgi:hypothetical protein
VSADWPDDKLTRHGSFCNFSTGTEKGGADVSALRDVTGSGGLFGSLERMLLFLNGLVLWLGIIGAERK